mgnify:CR=1 FL=1
MARSNRQALIQAVLANLLFIEFNKSTRNERTEKEKEKKKRKKKGKKEKRKRMPSLVSWTLCTNSDHQSVILLDQSSVWKLKVTVMSDTNFTATR